MTLAFLGDPGGWAASEVTTEALLAFMERTGVVWRRGYRVSAPGGAFGRGGSVAELSAAWAKNHLRLAHYALNLYADGPHSGPDYVSLHLVPSRSRHGIEWGGRIFVSGYGRVSVNAFAIELADSIRAPLRERFQAAEVVAGPARQFDEPEEVEVGRSRDKDESDTDSPLKRAKRVVARSAALYETQAVSAAVPKPLSRIEVAEAPRATPSESRAPNRWGAIARLLRDTAVQIIAGVLVVIIAAILAAWRFLPT